MKEEKIKGKNVIFFDYCWAWVLTRGFILDFRPYFITLTFLKINLLSLLQTQMENTLKREQRIDSGKTLELNSIQMIILPYFRIFKQVSNNMKE